jgi:hypothetical protein
VHPRSGRFDERRLHVIIVSFTGGVLVIARSLRCALVFCFASAIGGCNPDDDLRDTQPGIDSGTTIDPDSSPLPDSGAPDSTDSGPTSNVVREVFLHQLTYDDASRPAGVPAFSRNGQKIAFGVRGTPMRVFTINADGSGLKEVDRFNGEMGNPFDVGYVAISGDGNTIVAGDSFAFRVVNAGGTLLRNVRLDSNEISKVLLTTDGTSVLFSQRRDANTITGTPVPLVRGVHKVNVATGGITDVITPTNAAAAIGKTATDVTNFESCAGALAISGDGNTVAAGFRVGAGTGVVAAKGSTVKDLGGPPAGLVARMGVSKDGSLVAFHAEASNPLGGEVTVVSPDGTGKKKAYEVGIPDSCSAPLTIGDDNNTIGDGHTGTIYVIDGSKDPWQLNLRVGSVAPFDLLTGTGGGNSRLMSMSGDGTRFVYINADGPHPAHIVIAQVGKNELGATPALSDVRVSVPSIKANSATKEGTKAALFAKATPGSFLGGQVFAKGFVEVFSHADVPLLDDGKNFDKVAGDGLYSSGDQLYAEPPATIGPRILRIDAESKDMATGKRTGHFIDFTGFAVEAP